MLPFQCSENRRKGCEWLTRFTFFSLGEDDEEQDEVKPTEGPVVVEASIPVSLTPFGEVQLELPVKEEDLPPSEEKREVSDKELPEKKPPFGEVQVHIFLGLGTMYRVSCNLEKARRLQE